MDSNFCVNLSWKTKLYIVNEYEQILIKIIYNGIDYILLDLEELNVFMRYIIKHKIYHTIFHEYKKKFLLFKNNFNYPFMRCKDVFDYSDDNRKVKLTVESKDDGKETLVFSDKELKVLFDNHNVIIKQYLLLK